MRGLSIKQPWAWAIVNAGKRIENRSWPTHYRGPVLIHASGMRGNKQALLEEVEDGWESVMYMANASGVDLSHVKPNLGMFRQHAGGVVGRANLVDCVEAYDSPWFVGPWGFVLQDVEPTPFVQWPGSLGLWNVPARLLVELQNPKPRERAMATEPCSSVRSLAELQNPKPRERGPQIELPFVDDRGGRYE